MGSLSFYRAQIISQVLNEGKFKVRILPHMIEIRDEELPIWPMFFKRELSINKPGAYVWCLCNEDFTIGYIIGEANDFSNSPIQNLESLINGHLQNVIKSGGTINKFEDLKVYHIDDAFFEYVNITTGQKGQVNSDGAVQFMEGKKIIFSIGNSLVSLEPDLITISSKKVRFEGDIALGQGAGGVVTSTDYGNIITLPSGQVLNVSEKIVG